MISFRFSFNSNSHLGGVGETIPTTHSNNIPALLIFISLYTDCEIKKFMWANLASILLSVTHATHLNALINRDISLHFIHLLLHHIVLTPSILIIIFLHLFTAHKILSSKWLACMILIKTTKTVPLECYFHLLFFVHDVWTWNDHVNAHKMCVFLTGIVYNRFRQAQFLKNENFKTTRILCGSFHIGQYCVAFF